MLRGRRVLLLATSLVVALLRVTGATASGNDTYARVLSPLSMIEKRQVGGDCPSGGYLCPDRSGCCPIGVDCTIDGHCDIQCTPADPRCGDGCCLLAWHADCDPITLKCIIRGGPSSTSTRTTTSRPPSVITITERPTATRTVTVTTSAPTTARPPTAGGNSHIPQAKAVVHIILALCMAFIWTELNY